LRLVIEDRQLVDDIDSGATREMRVSEPVALVACASSSTIDSSSTTLTAVQRGSLHLLHQLVAERSRSQNDGCPDIGQHREEEMSDPTRSNWTLCRAHLVASNLEPSTI
jgi:hypothetical protein